MTRLCFAAERTLLQRHETGGPTLPGLAPPVEDRQRFSIGTKSRAPLPV